MKKLINFSIVAFLLGLITFYSCKKDDSMSGSAAPGTNQQRAYIFLTDDPGFFDQVMVDIRSVEVMVDTCANKDDWHDNNGWHRHGNHHGDDHHDSDCEYWTTLAITPGIYDLLTLRNGTDTLLAGGILPMGRIEKIKIQLGTNNSLVKDGVTYPLNLKHSESTITIRVKGEDWDEFRPGHVRLWLDFDVSRSIIKVHDNEFYLNPWITFFTVKTTGSVKGTVTPRDAYPVISFLGATDTAFAIPDKHGKFKVRGLDAGTYSMFVNASNGYVDTTITGINIMANKEIKMADIKLHK